MPGKITKGDRSNSQPKTSTKVGALYSWYSKLNVVEKPPWPLVGDSKKYIEQDHNFKLLIKWLQRNPDEQAEFIGAFQNSIKRSVKGEHELALLNKFKTLNQSPHGEKLDEDIYAKVQPFVRKKNSNGKKEESKSLPRLTDAGVAVVPGPQTNEGLGNDSFDVHDFMKRMCDVGLMRVEDSMEYGEFCNEMHVPVPVSAIFGEALEMSETPGNDQLEKGEDSDKEWETYEREAAPNVLK